MKEGLRLRDARVAWLIPVLGSGGSIRYNKPLLEFMAANCKAFRVFTAEFKGDKDVLEFDLECLGGNKPIFPYERVANQGTQGYWDEVSLMSPIVVPKLLKYRPNLVIINEFSLWSLYAIIAKQLMHEVRVLLAIETRPRFLQNRLISLMRKVLRTCIAKTVDAILTNNADGKDYLTIDLHAPAKRIIVKPYIVSDMAFVSGIPKKVLYEYRSSREAKLPVRFLFVGRLAKLKGLQYALEALKTLLGGYQGRFVLDIVGDGPFRENLEQQAHSMGLTQHVLFHGMQPYSTLWEWYKQADAFLFPTLGDYRALAPFEALSMGLPIVASIHDGGIGETVDAGRNGFSFDPHDPAMLAQILVRFLESPAIIPEFSRRSLEMASSYTLEQGTESLAYACQKTLDSEFE